MLVHKHLILAGRIIDPPTDLEFMQQWLTDMVEKIGMKILMGPIVAYSDMVNNRGMTGVVVIETSHIACHIWDEMTPALVEVDIYSCQDFNINIAIDHMKIFGLQNINFRFIDRSTSLIEEKLYSVYKTTNLINGKFYIGVHGGLNNDQYLGSGRALREAVKKYGKENFKKEIIKVFFNEDDAYAYEKQVVNYEFVISPENYNLTTGGRKGGIMEDTRKKKISDAHQNRPKRSWVTNGRENLLISTDFLNEFLTTNEDWQQGRTMSKKHLNKMGMKKGQPSWRKGLTLPEEHKLKIKNTMSEKFKKGHTIHNKGKKMYIENGKKIWISPDNLED